ncbi:MAG: glycosyltransferase family 4 protein [Candidatus Shapirobacteria bacterium]
MNSKVLVFCPYYPPHIGGLESHADEFNKYLVKNGFEITVFTPRLPKEAIKKEIRYSKVKIIRYPAWEIIPNYPLPCFWKKEYWNLKNELSSQKYNWVISRTRFFMTSVMAGIWAKKNKIKWLHIEHGSDFVKLNSQFKSFIAKSFDYTFGRWILKRADKIVANSLASAEFCKKIFPKRKYEVIYRGIEINGVKDNLKLKKEYKDKIKIAYTGRLIDGKGVRDLVEAVSKLLNDNWVLFIVGDGPRKKDLKDYVASLGLKSKIIFLGQLERLDSIGVINISDIVVNPSYTEGLPTSIIEAAKCGKAIVATDVGGTREIIDDGKSGVLIPVKDIEIMKDKIEILINNKKLREQLGDEAKKKVNDSFDWKASIKKYINILE